MLMWTQMIGLLTFCVMFRFSMLTGWWSLLRSPRRSRAASAGSVGDFVLINHPGDSKDPKGEVKMVDERNGVLSSSEKETEGLVAPEPGDVSRRHETTNLFDENEEEDEKRRLRAERYDDVV